jgi:hypothetical protein
MVAELRNKPGSGDSSVSIGDMTSTTAPGEFSLVYLVYNAITCLLTPNQQVQCFRSSTARTEGTGQHGKANRTVSRERRSNANNALRPRNRASPRSTVAPREPAFIQARFGAIEDHGV